jgi:hypothetical protein
VARVALVQHGRLPPSLRLTVRVVGASVSETFAFADLRFSRKRGC